jgi:hypothetical protein
MTTKSNYGEAKELSLICSYIILHDFLQGSIWTVFDKVYEIAEAFLEKYPLDTVWGFDDGIGDYEETLDEFTTNYILTKKWK